MEKEEVETIAGQREKERFSLGKKRIFSRHCRAGPGQTGPPPSGPPSGEKVREEERGRDLGGDFSEKVRERIDAKWEEGGRASHPPRSYPRLRLFFLPHVRAVTRETRTSMQNGSTSTPLLIVSHADIVHLMARARYAPGTILIIIERRGGVDDKSERRPGKLVVLSRAWPLPFPDNSERS